MEDNGAQAQAQAAMTVETALTALEDAIAIHFASNQMTPKDVLDQYAKAIGSEPSPQQRAMVLTVMVLGTNTELNDRLSQCASVARDQISLNTNDVKR